MLYHHALADESSYTCGSANEEGTASITCSSGVITSIDFASYGTPTGICGTYSVSGCNAVTSRNVVYSECINRASCSVNASNVVFGDPCLFIIKHLYIQVTCTITIQPSEYPSQSPTTLSPTVTLTSISLKQSSTNSTPVFWLTEAGLTIVIVLAVLVAVIVLAILLLRYCVLVRRPVYCSPTFVLFPESTHEQQSYMILNDQF